ncbi:MAG: RNA polymerase sigma factor [Minisyncoccota bacterium]
MHQSDKELVHAYQGGDEGALAVLIKRYLKTLYHLARSFVVDADIAEDIVQDTVVKMWRHLERYDDTQSFRAWLMRIAHNTAIDHIRKKRPQIFSLLESSDSHESFAAGIPDTEPLADEIFMRADERREAESLLSILPPYYREIVILRHYSDLTFEEISMVTQKPLNTVKSQHRRAVHKLRILLERQIPDDHTAPGRSFYS